MYTSADTPDNRLPTTAVISPEDIPSDTDSTGTPPLLAEAIDSIENYEYQSPITTDTPDTTNHNEALELYMMFNTCAPTELPQLRTEPWPYSGKKPNPISISKARRLLATAYAAVPCELAGTGDHGYAWMIESKEEWCKRQGVDNTIDAPTKPTKERDYDIKQRLEYADKMDTYRMYKHLMHEGCLKIIEWFGKPMFVDLYVNDMLPVTTTPTELIEHLRETYCQGRDNRRYMEQVEKDFNSEFDSKGPVEAYFLKLQEARSNAELLGQPFTEAQTMNKALAQFEKYLGKSAYKAEKRWNESKSTGWTAFKVFWKDELHQWDTVKEDCEVGFESTGYF